MITSPAEQKHLEELTAWSLSLGDKAFVHQHVVDAWAAQHASQQSRPISVAFALIGLYLHLERGVTGRQVQRVHMLLGQPRGRGPGRKDWPRFPLPLGRGNVRVSEVVALPEGDRVAAIDRWCSSVWAAWGESHKQVKNWAARDLSDPPTIKTIFGGA